LKTKLSIAIATALSLPVYVQAETEQLTTVVIEGNASRPGAMAMAPDASGLKDSASLLEHVPGANVNRNGALTGIPQYRGMAGGRINVSIDGANMKEVGPNSMDPSLSHVPAALTESLTVYRGIAPVSSGIDTIGGSMKMTSKKGHFAEGEGEIESDGVLSSGYSSVDNGYYVAGFTSIANENHKLHLGVTKEEGGDYKYSGNKKVSPSSYDRQALSVGYAYQRENHHLQFNFTDNNTLDAGTPALPMDIRYVEGGLYNLNYTWDLAAGYELDTKFYYQNMKHYMDNATLRDPARIMNGAPMLMDNTTHVEGGGWDIALTMPMGTGDLKVGFTGDKSNHEADMHMNMNMMMPVPHNMDVYTSLFNKIERSRYSFFGEWKGDITEKLSTELGLRYTYTLADSGDVTTNSMDAMMQTAATTFNNKQHDKDFHGVDLVAMLRYEMNSELDFELGFARKTRAPSYQELYLWMPSEASGGLADGRTYVGNLDLDLETAYQFEFGFDWHTDKAYISPRVFYHYVNDYIQGTEHATLIATQGNCPTSSACSVMQFNNIEAQLFGVDVEGGLVLNEYFRLDAGLNYVEGQRLDGDKSHLYRIAPLNGRTQLTFEHSGFMASIEGVYYAAQNKVSTYNNEKTTRAYNILNLRANYEPFEGFLVGTGIENVIDTVNYNHLGGYNRVKGNADLATNSRIPLQGRNYYVTLSYQW